ncbi:hypothetical protein [Lentzea sp. NBRC 102530]|uniref:hypothetical protein n=1 Tax=Lentzea sp. NBRC 102530 TaxID=3032201 RepID=UPI0024A1E4D6|nr:hypothetical protein [Lentzea sp. NBRC 102530]GLY53758.1 hypothetical protein Lesp01_74140 [Lentzea sp. NBRC 102530]
MAVLPDTATLPLRDRRDALITTLRDASGTSRVEPEDDEPVRARIALWSFGTASILRADSNGFANIGTTRSSRRQRVSTSPSECTRPAWPTTGWARPPAGCRGRSAALSLNTSAEHLALPADLLSPGPAAEMLGAASIELARALIATAAANTTGAGDVLE